jgi:hypothetical protein
MKTQPSGPVRAAKLQGIPALFAARHEACEASIREKEPTMQKDKDQVEGEGSYSGSKDYNERTRKFVDSGKVEKAAKDAEPKDEQEKHEMQKAERVGKEHAKEEDPALRNPKKVPHEGHAHTKEKGK